jgi:hypothetical protein
MDYILTQLYVGLAIVANLILLRVLQHPIKKPKLKFAGILLLLFLLALGLFI